MQTPAIWGALPSPRCHPSFLGVRKAPPRYINRGKPLIRKGGESRPSRSVIGSHLGWGSVERVTWLCQKLRVKPRREAGTRQAPFLLPECQPGALEKGTLRKGPREPRLPPLWPPPRTLLLFALLLQDFREASGEATSKGMSPRALITGKSLLATQSPAEAPVSAGWGLPALPGADRRVTRLRTEGTQGMLGASGGRASAPPAVPSVRRRVL